VFEEVLAVRFQTWLESREKRKWSEGLPKMPGKAECKQEAKSRKMDSNVLKASPTKAPKPKDIWMARCMLCFVREGAETVHPSQVEDL
jgi:hypothetical protein